MQHTQPTPQPVAKKWKAKVYAIVAVVITLGVVLGVSLAFLSPINNPVKVASTVVTLAVVTVHCTNCSYDSTTVHSQFSGALNDGTGIRSVDGNDGDTYTLTRTNRNQAWFISWNFHMNSGTGTMEVVVTLNTGEKVFDQSTSTPYGVAAGSWST